MKTPRLPSPVGSLLLAALLPLALRAQAPAPAAPALAPVPKVEMKSSAVFDWKNLVAKENPNGQRRVVFDGPSAKMDELECHITTLKVGQTSGTPHTHVDEELTIVNEGTVEVVINDRTQVIGKGSVFYFAPQDTVGIRNAGKTPATYTVIKMTVHAVPVATK
jgi:XRE family transcriptional regulator, regulator of sulfur utilization